MGTLKEMRLLSYKGSSTVTRLGDFFARHFLSGPPYVTVKTRYGIVLIPKNMRVFTMKYDLLEPEIRVFLEKTLRDMDYFINVGAAEGYYLLKAKALNPYAKMIGFEPDGQAYTFLQANLSMNNMTDSVQVFRMALSDENDKTVEVQTCMGKGKVLCTSRTLDSLCVELNLQITIKSLILIDVEGMGVRVLKGALSSLRASMPRIIMELHHGEEEAGAILTGLGYVVTRRSEFFLVAEPASL